MNGVQSLLSAVSPLEGRYADKIGELKEYFSEGALIKQRVEIEVRFVLALVKFLGTVRVNVGEEKRILSWARHLSNQDLTRVKEIEKETNHDVKAVEYFIRESLPRLNLTKLSPWIHWSLTSEDVNNLAYGVICQRFKDEELVELETEVVNQLKEMAMKYKRVVMPARTHGQVALPTTLGKELAVFVGRLSWWLEKVKKLKLGGKLNGAVGNFNSQQLLYPQKNWLEFSRKFVVELGLEPVLATTQIEPGDHLVYFLDLVRGLNNVYLNLSQDFWLYIALDYLKQRVIAHEVGSSTMPHKVNPIDFENCEGNLEVANSLLMMMSNKLGISRLQRDLSDSTVKRNLGVALGHTVVARKSLLKGLGKVVPEVKFLEQEVMNHPEMLGEAEQLRLKTEGQAGAYEQVKRATRGKGSQAVNSSWQVEKFIGLTGKITEMVVKKK